MSPSVLEPGGHRRRRWPLWAGAALLVIAGAAAAVYFLFIKAPGNVSHPNVEFTAPQPAPPPKPTGPAAINWPLYGRDAQRTRFMPEAHAKPPFRMLWRFRGNSLIEFQPVLAQGRLFVIENDGRASALSARSGKVLWRRSVGRLAAASPAWKNGRVYMVGNHGGAAGIASAGPGQVFCVDAKTGKVFWESKLASASESSPLITNGRVFLGSQDGTVYALDASNGHIVWRHRAAGPVKAALAFQQGRLYFGDYSGEMTSLRASDGSVAWRTGTSGRSFSRAGNFYATAALAYGRVYAGNTDGFIYSFAATTGQLAWSRSTGGYVYAAPAVGTLPGMAPAVFAGSYSGRFFALDARSGDVLWTYNAGGKISGAGSLIGGTVYFSNLAAKTTIGLNARSGREVWKFSRGAFNPAISDGNRLYITGYNSIYAFKPRGAAATPGKAAVKPRKAPRKPAKPAVKPRKKGR
jgi:outer membrane protein assembly factor BamB